MAVLNKYHHGGCVPDGAVNIMRGTVFGNPFPMINMTREESIAAFRQYLWNRIQKEPEFAAKVTDLYGQDLCCCCAPLPCHGDVLERAATYLAQRDAKMPTL